MQVDHIVIFSNSQGDEADELVRFGLAEGSNRVHPGQGTRNRKFYFENVFLEIAWVYNEAEVLSEAVRPTRLWERANHNVNGCSPFGLCLRNTGDTGKLFAKSLRHQPVYVPDGHSFDIITNEANPHLPWTCRVPYTDWKSLQKEPRDHKFGIKNLTKVKLGIPKKDFQNSFTDLLSSGSNVNFEAAENYSLTLEFDNMVQGGSMHFSSLSLTVRY